MLALPAYEQLRILHEQKHPKQVLQVFRTPYYQTALSGIRAHYRTSSPSALSSATLAARRLRPLSRSQHNLRVLGAFSVSPQASRQLVPAAAEGLTVSVGRGVDLKLRFDLAATENGAERRIFFNVRDLAPDPEMARTTLEIASWVLALEQIGPPERALEYVDLKTGTVVQGKKVRSRTISMASANIALIETLWPTI